MKPATNRWSLCWGCVCLGLVWNSLALDIQLPPETGVFKQSPGAELANGQCLVCHSVEYVTSQPSMGRAFWKAAVVKMQQKYGAPIDDKQIEPLADYLTRNYGSETNAAGAAPVATSQPAVSNGNGPTQADGPQLALKYGCLGCHNPTVKIVGPAYREIAAKYKMDTDAFSKIEQQIHKGGSGKWGPIIMPPFPQINPAEIKALADWILSLK